MGAVIGEKAAVRPALRRRPSEMARASGRPQSAGRLTPLTGAAVVLLVLVVLTAAAATRSALRHRASNTTRATPPDVTAPEGARVRVQVLNGTTIRGLAQRATRQLRDRGFDVLEIGTSREQRDTTLVLDRSNHPQWAKRVADALGGARVDTRPDSSRYLDVTVLVGATWRPPAQPFHP